jgi:hypothetical protein
MASDKRKWKLHRRCDAKCVAARGAANAPIPVFKAERLEDRDERSRRTVRRVNEGQFCRYVLFEATDKAVCARILKLGERSTMARRTRNALTMIESPKPEKTYALARTGNGGAAAWIEYAVIVHNAADSHCGQYVASLPLTLSSGNAYLKT